MLSQAVRPFRPKLNVRRSHRSPSSIRQFHASQGRQGFFIDLSHTVFQNIHTFAGLSWAGSIFLTGGLMRLSFAPVQLYGMAIQKRRQETMPLQAAHMKVIQLIKDVKFIGRPTSQAEADDRARWYKEEVAKRTKKILETYNVRSTWITIALGWVYLPIWAVNAGVVQAMSGVGGRGFLSYIVDPAALPPPEPGFAAEGLEWIPALTVPDPFYLLPIMFGILLHLNLKSAGPLANLNIMESAYRSVTGLRRAQLSVQLQFLQFIKITPLLSVFFLANIPSAILLFLCGSASTSLLMRPILAAIAGLPRQQPQYMLPRTMTPQVKPEYAKIAHQMDIFRPPGQSNAGATLSDSPAASARSSTSGQGDQARPVARAGVQKAGPSRHLRM